MYQRTCNHGILIAFIKIFLAPYIFTRETFLWFDFEKTGQIGDTIGGITAPVINLFAALLIYIAFKEQVRANEIQISALKEEKTSRINDIRYETIISELNWCANEYDKISYKEVVGVKAIDMIIRDRYSERITDSEILLMYQNIFGLKNYLNKLTTMIESIHSDEYKAILSNKLLLVYRTWTKKFKSKLIDHTSYFSNPLKMTEEEFIDSLLLDKYTIEQLEKYRFKLNTSALKSSTQQ